MLSENTHDLLHSLVHFAFVLQVKPLIFAELRHERCLVLDERRDGVFQFAVAILS